MKLTKQRLQHCALKALHDVGDASRGQWEESVTHAVQREGLA